MAVTTEIAPNIYRISIFAMALALQVTAPEHSMTTMWCYARSSARGSSGKPVCLRKLMGRRLRWANF